MNKTPAVRFKGFTEDWEQRKLCEITTEKLTNGVMNYRSVEPTDVRHINVINMYTSDEIHIDELSFSAYDDSVLNKCNVEFGDVFLTRSSLKPEGIAEPNVLLANGRFVFDDHLIRMKINKKKYDPCFIKICLETRHIKEQFIKSSKTTAFTTIGQDDIADCIGFFPDITEQKSLALIFSSIDNLITLHQRKYEKLVNIKKSMLYKMFPQNGSKVPEIRFAGFTDDWEQQAFEKAFDYLQNNTLSRAELNNENGVAKNVHYGDVLIKFGEYLDISNSVLPYITSQQVTNRFRSSLLKNGDVVMADTAEDETVGKCTELAGISHYPIISGLHTIPLRPKIKFAAGYLGYYMNSSRYHNQLLPLIQGTKVSSISKNALKNTSILFPSKTDEQRLIGQFFIQLDDLIIFHQRKLEKLKQLKQAMLHKMFV